MSAAVLEPPPGATGPARTRGGSGWATPVIAIAMLLVWELLARLWLSGDGLVAAPTEILRSIADDPSLYWNALIATGWTAVRGWFFGNVVAVLLALLFVRFSFAELLMLRAALTLYCLPFVAIMPILLVAFEVGTAQVVLASIAVFFSTLINGVLGLRSVDGNQLTLVRAWGGGNLAALRFVRLRSAVPAVMTGLQIGAPAAVLGAIFSEFMGARRGLGVLLINALAMLDVPRIWAVAVLATLLGAVPYAVLRVVAGRLSPWSAGLTPAQEMATARPVRPALAVLRSAAWVVGSVVTILVAWRLFLAVFDVAPYVGKTPGDVLDYLVTGPDAAEQRGEVLDALGITLQHAGIGYVSGLVIGVGFAVLFTLAPITERLLGPLTIALQAVPIVTMTPILIVIFGRGAAGVAAITTIVTFFPTVANVQHGLRRVPDDALLLMRSYAASTGSRLWRVQLPFSLPALFASARIAAPTSVLAATVAEWLATGDGLGNLIITAQTQASFTKLWAGATVLTAVSLLFYSAVSAAERQILRRYSLHAR